MLIENEEAFHAAIKSLRDTTSQTEWILVSHVDNNSDSIRLVGSGSGGYETLSASFDDSCVMYGLIRVQQKIDLSTTTKYVYIYFIGEQVPALARGKIGRSHSTVKQSLSPFHADFEITNAGEISVETITAKVAETSGVVNKSKDVNHSSQDSHQGAKKAVFGFQGNSKEVRGGSGLDIDQKIVDAIADVRNNKTETNWALASYPSGSDVKKPLELIGTGNGGANELTSNLSSNMIAYGLVRVVDVIEGIKTVKFVFIIHIGSDVPITKKATVATHKGGVIDKFGSIHITLEVSGDHEISDEIILSKVQESSGSKSKVK